MKYKRKKYLQLQTSNKIRKIWATTIINLLCFTAPLSMCVLWVKSIQLALGNLDVSAKWCILQRTKQYLIIYILYVRATTVLFISLKIGVKEKWEPWVLLNLNSIKKIMNWSMPFCLFKAWCAVKLYTLIMWCIHIKYGYITVYKIHQSRIRMQYFFFCLLTEFQQELLGRQINC